jgi:hypothetical protein
MTSACCLHNVVIIIIYIYGSLKAICKSRTGVRLGKFQWWGELCFAGAAISVDGCLLQTPINHWSDTRETVLLLRHWWRSHVTILHSCVIQVFIAANDARRCATRLGSARRKHSFVKCCLIAGTCFDVTVLAWRKYATIFYFSLLFVLMELLLLLLLLLLLFYYYCLVLYFVCMCVFFLLYSCSLCNWSPGC